MQESATAVHTGPDGHIFVADFYNHRIQKFSPAGTFLVAFGHHGSGPSAFERPADVTADEDGNVYVVDFGNERVQKFAPVHK